MEHNSLIRTICELAKKNKLQIHKDSRKYTIEVPLDIVEEENIKTIIISKLQDEYGDNIKDFLENIKIDKIIHDHIQETDLSDDNKSKIIETIVGKIRKIIKTRCCFHCYKEIDKTRDFIVISKNGSGVRRVNRSKIKLSLESDEDHIYFCGYFCLYNYLLYEDDRI